MKRQVLKNRAGGFSALLLITGAICGGCRHAPPERKLVDDAAEALGGRDRILAVKTLTIEGQGIETNLGQNVTPEGELPVWKVTEFRETIDPGAGRMRIRETRAAQFLFALATVQKQDQGLDGDVAYNVAADGKAARASVAVAHDRRLALLHHPLTLIRAALDPAAKIGNLRREGSQQLAEITTAQGDLLTLAVDTAVFGLRNCQRLEAAETPGDSRRPVSPIRSPSEPEHDRRPCQHLDCS
jgi:hypothetical protein